MDINTIIGKISSLFLKAEKYFFLFFDRCFIFGSKDITTYKIPNHMNKALKVILFIFSEYKDIAIIVAPMKKNACLDNPLCSF